MSTDTPRFQIMPPLSGGEYADLEKSIIEHGVMLPIIVDENGEIIDGHHREKIAKKLGVECPRDIRPGFNDAEKIAMALTLNIDRRHLTQQQKRQLLEKSITADPELSDREHGRRTGTDNKTAAKVRTELEGREEIPHAEKRTDSTGRQQPASKPKLTVVASKPEPKGDLADVDPQDNPQYEEYCSELCERVCVESCRPDLLVGARARDLADDIGMWEYDYLRWSDKLEALQSDPHYLQEYNEPIAEELSKLVSAIAVTASKLPPTQRAQVAAPLLKLLTGDNADMS